MATHKTEKSGTEIVSFLKSFEGAASAFTDASDTWALWIPEIVTGEFPVTPGSQIYFPVILRQGQMLIAIRFFYDCRTGKVKFYTGAIPTRLSSLPEFEHAVSELFRHSLPVEPIKQRQFRRVDMTPQAPAAPEIQSPPRRTERSHRIPTKSPSTPTHVPVLSKPTVRPVAPPPEPKSQPAPDRPDKELAVVTPAVVAVAVPERPPSAQPDPAPKETVAKLKVEICTGTTRVLQVLILVLGILGIAALAAFVYLEISEDPGLKHHRLQVEQMRLRSAP